MRTNEKGQALILTVAVLGIVLIGGIGLAIDGTQMYAHREMAQAAADSAAEAAISSIFNATYSTATGGAAFDPSSSFTCTTTDKRTPCVYAANNGFGTTASDTVVVDFPASPAYGIGGSPNFAHSFARVTITRTLNTGFMAILGSTTSTIKALGVAAIVQSSSPIPIIVTHPSLDGALSLSGNSQIIICGGAARSIQVNSTSSTAFAPGGTSTVDLSHAGLKDDGLCNSGTGADFGLRGGPTTKPSALILGLGNYVEPDAIMPDPLRTVAAPSLPAAAPAPVAVADGLSGCPPPLTPPKPCAAYFPGKYPGGLKIQNQTAVFAPGVYYMDCNAASCASTGGFGNASNGQMFMCTDATLCPDSADTGGRGMMVYIAGDGVGSHSDGTFNIGSNSNATLVGSSIGSAYRGILFFEDRSAPAHTSSGSHVLGGGGNISLNGTIYLHNTTATSTTYQNLRLRGNSGNTTRIDGEIIANALDLGGGGIIRMNLLPGNVFLVDTMALVH